MNNEEKHKRQVLINQLNKTKSKIEDLISFLEKELKNG